MAPSDSLHPPAVQRQELERLVRVHQATLYRYLRYLGAEAALAEDLVQETFLATLKPSAHQPASMSDDSAWSPWLRGIARNLFLAECRKRRTHERINLELALDSADETWTREFAADADLAEHLAALKRCLQTLPARQRDVLQHRYVKETGRSEMARLLGMSDDGVKSLLRRIRAALAQCVQERMDANTRKSP